MAGNPKPKISVITPSIRPAGLEIVRESLGKQMFDEFEWLTEIGVPNRGHDLNQAFNRMLRRAEGELIVIYQDYIKAPPMYLQHFWDAYQANPDTFFTSPVGKVDNLDYTGEIKWDWRAWNDKDGLTDYVPSRWDTWEIDSGAAPLAALKKIGGFDEELDQYWSCDNVNVGCRAELAGYKFINVFSNPVLAYDHDAHIEHPFRDYYKPEFNNERMNAFRQGLKIDYLSNNKV